MSGRISTAVAEEGWAGRRLPGIDDASLMAHPEPAVQSFQDLHNRAGIAGAFPALAAIEAYVAGTSPYCPWPPSCGAMKHRTCSRDRSEPRGRYADSEHCGGTRKRRLYRGRNRSSTPLASLMLLAPANRSSVTSRSWKVPAARSTRPLAWGERANIICIPSSSMAPAELGRRRREAGPWCVPEDPVPVDVEGDGNANALQQVLDQQEIGVGLLLRTEQGVGHRAGGIIDCDQQRERRNLVPQPRVVAAVHLDQHPHVGAFAGGVPGAWADAFAADSSARR